MIWQPFNSAPSPHAALEEYFNVSALGLEHGGFVRSHAFGLVEGLAGPKSEKFMSHGYWSRRFKLSLKSSSERG